MAKLLNTETQSLCVKSYSPWRHPDRFLLALFWISLLCRVLLTFYRRFNVDEFQHLHASWMVHLGFMPYTDFWENHAPLLYFLSAPVLSVLGEGANTVLVMRFIHSAAGVAIAAVVYKIARLDYDRTTAILSVVVLSFSEIYLQKTIEIRTDQFLVLFWLLSLWFCFRGIRSSKNAELWSAGFCLGIAMLFSPKAIICYVPAALIIFARWFRPAMIAIKKQLFFFSGFIIPCIALGLYFFFTGSFKNLIDSTIFQNLTYPDTRGPSFLLLPQNLSFLLLGLAGMALTYRDLNLRSNARFQTPVLLMIAALIPALILIFFMPSTFSQSALIFVPLFAIYAGIAFKKSLQWNAPRRSGQILFSLFAILAAFLIPMGSLLIRVSKEETNGKQMEVLRYLLKNTKPDEALFDGNSAYIFRRQAYFYGSLVEGIRHKIKQGEIQQSIVESLKQNRCRIVLYDDRVSDLPEEVQTWIRNNYVPATQEDVFIAGQTLDDNDLTGNKAIFRIEIPLSYTIKTGGKGKLTIDRDSYGKSIFLKRGWHTLTSNTELRGVQIRAEER